MSDASIPPVTHDRATNQFRIDTGSGIALLKYVPGDGTLDLVHTEVPPAFEGQGYGSALAEAALAYAKAEGKRIVPSCPFVQKYVEKHPEHQALVAAA